MRYAKIDASLFIKNRENMVSQLPKDSLAVLNSNDLPPTSADGVRPFVQQTDIFYLSGIDQEESVLLLSPDAAEESHKEILFLKKTSPQIALWEGEKLTKEKAREISGISTIYWLDDFEQIFHGLMVNCTQLFLNSNEHLRKATAVESRDRRFLDWCKNRYPLHSYRRLQPILHHLRAIKSEIEIKLIAEACQITEKAFRRLLAFVRPGVQEYEIEAEIVHEFLINRSRRPAYDPIIASGKNACVLHYIENNATCQEGELLLLDFGAEYANYAADLSRTIPVNGRFSDRQKQLYQAVLNVQKEAIRMLRPGTLMKDYVREVGKIMENELIEVGLLDRTDVKKQNPQQPLYKKYFMHGISHHLGLDVHDYGSFLRPFAPGMVFTVEPGIYLPEEGIGIRIENNLLITQDAPLDLMANIPREIAEIEEIMHN